MRRVVPLGLHVTMQPEQQFCFFHGVAAVKQIKVNIFGTAALRAAVPIFC